jgi:hypothetical protein
VNELALEESAPSAAPDSPLPADPRASRLARAYCGPAHGQSWPLSEHAPPPADVVLRVATQSLTYRLIRHPGSHRPARDRSGHYLYMPVLYRTRGPVPQRASHSAGGTGGWSTGHRRKEGGRVSRFVNTAARQLVGPGWARVPSRRTREINVVTALQRLAAQDQRRGTSMVADDDRGCRRWFLAALFTLPPPLLALVFSGAAGVSVLARMPANARGRLGIAVSVPVDASFRAWIGGVLLVAGVGVLVVTGISGVPLLALLCATSPPVLSRIRARFPEVFPANSLRSARSRLRVRQARAEKLAGPWSSRPVAAVSVEHRAAVPGLATKLHHRVPGSDSG